MSADGVRQDLSSPNDRTGQANSSLELALDGARAVAAADGADPRLQALVEHWRTNKLRAVDKTGRDLKARIDILSPGRLVVRIDDTAAVYPVRIDPTFSDANWVSLNPGIPGMNGNVTAMTADGSGNIYAAGLLLLPEQLPLIRSQNGMSATCRLSAPEDLAASDSNRCRDIRHGPLRSRSLHHGRRSICR